MELKLNTLDLTTGNYIVQEMQIDDAPPIALQMLDYASFDGAKFVDRRYNPKTIRLLGRITGTTQTTTEQNIDTLKKTLLNDTNINLNFSYAGGYRQFVGNISQCSIVRDRSHVNMAVFDITFEASDPPFSVDIANINSTDPTYTEMYTAEDFSGNTRSGTFTIDGTAPPMVRWQYVFDTVSGAVESIEFKSLKTGRTISIPGNFTAGDLISIDQENFNVTKNGQEIDYNGIFPTFDIGANEFQFNIYGSTTGIILDQSDQVYTTVFSLFSEWGQSFVPTILGTLDKINIRIFKNNSASTSLRCRLYTAPAHVPSTFLKEITVDISGITPGGVYEVELPFAYSSLVDEASYCFTVLGDSNVYILADIFANYADGQSIVKSSSGVFTTNSARDLYFKTYMRRNGSATFDHTSDIKIEAKPRYL